MTFWVDGFYTIAFLPTSKQCMDESIAEILANYKSLSTDCVDRIVQKPIKFTY